MEVMSAKLYSNQDITGWLLSEKLDGVRAIWDGEKLLTKTGKKIHVPDWFIKGFPQGVILDGELTMGRGTFQETVGIVRSHSGDWSRVWYSVFDMVGEQPFKKRYDTLRYMVLPSVIEIEPQFYFCNEEEFKMVEEEFLEDGAEGMMVRDPDAPYVHKRTDCILKVKRFITEECKVTSYTEGTGRNKGRVGALWSTYNNLPFKIGTGLSDEDRDNPPPVGSIITFKYFELTNRGVPRFPSFIGVRDYE